METQEDNLNLAKYWQILKEHRLSVAATFLPVFFISLLILSLKKPAYEAEAKLSFQRTNTISSLTGFGTEINRLEPLVDDRSNPLNTEAEVIRSVPIVQKTISKLNLKNKKGEPITIKEFNKNLMIKDVKGSDVLQVSYRDSNPKTAADVVNNLIQIYLDQNIVFHRMEVATARTFIEKQLPKAELVVRHAEVKLRDFKEENHVVALAEEATRAVERMAELQRQIGDAESRIANLDAQSEAIRNQLKMNSEQAVTTTSLSQSPGVQDVLTKIQELETELATKKITLLDTHPTVINLESNLASLREILQKRATEVAGTSASKLNNNFQIGELQQTLSARLVDLETTRLGLTNELIALTNLQSNYKKRLEVLPRLEQQQRELERQLEAAQYTYSLLLQKLQESRIAENQNVGNARIISAAEIPEDSISSPIISYLSAGLIASLATLISMYILKVTDKSVKTVDDAKKLFGITLLGVIPAFNGCKKLSGKQEESEIYSQILIVRNFPRSSISEAYRMLRANLKFLSADKELKSIVVTSSIVQEGKSTVAANLAVAIAQMECKVLLIDGDLHRPIQHKIWELSNSEGLSNVIVGQANIKTAIKRVMENLYVLTSGVIPPNPASLLDSKRMASLIDSFAANYDFIIIDAPSITVAADAVTMGQMADGVLFVVRPGIVDSDTAIFAKELLEKSGQNVLGQVVNGVILDKKRQSYYSTEEYNFDTLQTTNPYEIPRSTSLYI
jgi:succinoglycan biosynthesis transport protein ExoP